MNQKRLSLSREHRFALLLSMLMAGVLLLAGWQTIQAQGPKPYPADLDTSSKSVDKDMAEPGDNLTYEIVVRNTGDDFAVGLSLTDTLPAEVTYVPNTLAADSGTAGESNGVITWTGVLNANGGEVMVSFDAVLTDTLQADMVVTNTVVITGTGTAITRTAATTIFTDSISTTSYLPILYKPYPAPPTPNLSLAGRPSPENLWTLTWSVGSDEYVDEYQILEAHNPNFSDATIIGTSANTQYTVDKPLLQDNVLYYRVRSVGPGGTSAWSNAQQVIASYLDDFSGDKDWKIRRQDLDDTTNYSYYDNGHYVLEIDGRWDYAISSPLQPAPEPPYRISTSVFLDQPGNLNTYGIIFGGSWDGESECPNDEYGGCLSHYYRLLFIWFGSSADHMSVQLKRIDYHDDNNQGRGDTTIFEGVYPVASPPEGYQPWSVEVHPDGTIRLYHGNNLRASGQDTEYINDPYFGVFAATDEYLGAEPHFDWYRVQRIAQ